MLRIKLRKVNWISSPWFSGRWMLNNQFRASFLWLTIVQQLVHIVGDVVHRWFTHFNWTVAQFLHLCVIIYNYTQYKFFLSVNRWLYYMQHFLIVSYCRLAVAVRACLDWTLKKCLRQAASLGLQIRLPAVYSTLKLVLLLAKNWDLLITNERIFKSRGWQFLCLW